MPIRAENKGRYPVDWPAISARIRQRAGNHCEECGVKNYALGGRESDGRWRPAEPKGCNGVALVWPEPGEFWWCEGGRKLRIIRIVLTVAHLDHQPENCADKNLRAWCQRCHLNYDRAEKRRGMRERARVQMAAGDLFEARPSGEGAP